MMPGGPFWTRSHDHVPGLQRTLEEEGEFCKVARTPSLSESMISRDFVEELTCALCLEIFVEACNVNPCGHVFCKGCIAKLARNHRNRQQCPVCKVRIHEVLVPAIIVRSMIARMDVRCRYGLSFNIRTSMFEVSPDGDAGGCKVTLKAGSHEMHELICPHAIRACKWRSLGCRFVGVSESADRHEATCNWRTESCCWCFKLIPGRELEPHMKFACRERVEACPNAKHGCDEFPRRGKLREHIDHECLFEKVREFFEAKDRRILELETQVQRLSKEIMAQGLSPKRQRMSGEGCSHRPIAPVKQEYGMTCPEQPESSSSQPAKDTLSQIFVECSSKKLLSLPVFLATDTPRCLFPRIARAWNISPKQYQLSFRRQVLDNSRSFASQGVDKDSTLRVVPIVDLSAEDKARMQEHSFL